MVCPAVVELPSAECEFVLNSDAARSMRVEITDEHHHPLADFFGPQQRHTRHRRWPRLILQLAARITCFTRRKESAAAYTLGTTGQKRAATVRHLCQIKSFIFVFVSSEEPGMKESQYAPISISGSVANFVCLVDVGACVHPSCFLAQLGEC